MFGYLYNIVVVVHVIPILFRKNWKSCTLAALKLGSQLCDIDPERAWSPHTERINCILHCEQTILSFCLASAVQHNFIKHKNLPRVSYIKTEAYLHIYSIYITFYSTKLNQSAPHRIAWELRCWLKEFVILIIFLWKTQVYALFFVSVDKKLENTCFFTLPQTLPVYFPKVKGALLSHSGVPMRIRVLALIQCCF